MDIYLIRHGETESNKERRYQGWSESPLSETGLRQAERAGDFLAGKSIETIYCSDLNRAFHTARVIGIGSGLQPQVTPLLREIHFGQWEGMTFQEIEATWGDAIANWLDDPFKTAPPGGETLEKVCARMQAFLDQIVQTPAEGSSVVAVSHGGSIRALLYLVLRLEQKSFWDLKVDNASVSLLRRKNGRFQVEYYNRVEHLEHPGANGVIDNGDQ